MKYLDRARARARHRKSLWNLLLPVALFIVFIPLYVLLLAGSDFVQRQLDPTLPLPSQRRGVGVILEALSLFFAVIPIALVVANSLVWLIGPARRALDAEARARPGSSFSASQRALLKLAAWWVPAALVLAVIGALLPW